MKIDVSVVIVSYNTKDLTLDCIKSLNSDNSSINKEIIVIDNGSTDGTLDAIRNSKLQFIDSKIEIFENKNNLGFAKAINQGIKIAKVKYIFILNSDTKIVRGTIRKLLEFAKKKLDAGVIAPKLLNPNGSVQGSVFRFPTISRAFRQYILGKEGILDKYAPLTDKPAHIEVATMAAFLITPLCLKKVGLLDERYFMYFEDFDYCRRVKENGLKIYYLPGAEVVHCHGESGKDLVDEPNQWRRLIPSSKIYHGTIGHYLINLIIWLGQKKKKYFFS
jgi:GT2 family glycosyltransferase